jgi:hypothetical protein
MEMINTYEEVQYNLLYFKVIVERDFLQYIVFINIDDFESPVET